MENHYGLWIILLLPIIGAFLSFYIGKKDKQKRNDFIDLLLGVEIITLGYMVFSVIGKGNIMKLSLHGVFGLGVYFEMDEIRAILCMTTTWIYAIVAWFMKISMKEKANTNRFYLFYLLSFGMVQAAFLSNNFFNFIIFIVLAMFLVYPMIVHREDPQALKNGSIYLLFVVIGMVLVTLAIAIIFGYTRSVSYYGILAAMDMMKNQGFLLFGTLLMILGLCVFSGAFPLQYQVTRGASYGLMEASAVFVSIISKFGIYAMMLLAGTLLRENVYTGRFILVIGLMTTIWGLFISLTVTDIRKILMGINVVTNGFNILGVGLMIVSQVSNGFAMRGCFYMMVSSSLSLTMLYMAAMEQVCKVHKYEIKGLIESGKKNKMLAVVCFLACANLGGLPGTFGFLGHSMFYQTSVTILHSKWLVVTYLILWAFLLTSVTRIFMKLFISKKEEPIHMLTTKEETKSEDVEEVEEDSPYLSGEFMLLVVGLLQMMFGLVPNQTIEHISGFMTKFFHGEILTGWIPYYTKPIMIGFLIVLVLCILLYTNLVHGILLRTVRNKKNKKLQKEYQKKEMEKEDSINKKKEDSEL